MEGSGADDRIPAGMTVGLNTFRGMTAANSTFLRSTLYQKNGAFTRTDDLGLVRTESPISGSLLLSRHSVQQAVRDPMTGTKLKFHGDRAEVTTPVQKNQFKHTRTFYLTRDVDITLQTLRNTTTVTRYTNEKVGTAGTPTGMGSSLKAFRELQAASAGMAATA